jgi:glucokinase
VILAADIGGTNARLGLFELDGPTLRSVTIRRYPSRGHASLEEIVERFLGEVGRPVEAACFAVAGPVSEGRVALTNLGWTVVRTVAFVNKRAISAGTLIRPAATTIGGRCRRVSGHRAGRPPRSRPPSPG